MLWLLLSLAHAGPCEASTDLQDLAGALGSAEVAFSAMDEGAFTVATSRAQGVLDCLAEPLTPPDAAAWHRVAGLGAFLEGDPVEAGLFFAASRTLQPGYQLPSSVAPPGHPLRAAWEGASPGGAVVEVGPGESAWLVVDGQRSTAVPADRPVLVQWVAADGAVTRTRLVRDPSELPSPAATPPPPPAVVVESTPPALPPAPVPRPRRLGLKVGVGTATAGAVVGAAVCYGLAARHSGNFWDATTPPTQLAGERDLANRNSWAAVGLAGVALAGGTTLVLTW